MQINPFSTLKDQFFINGRGDRLKFNRNEGDDTIWDLYKPDSDDIVDHPVFSHFMQYDGQPSELDIAQPEGGLIPFDPDNPIIESILRVEYEDEQFNAVLVFDNHLLPTFERDAGYNRFVIGSIFGHFLDIDDITEVTESHKILGVIAHPANTKA